MSPNLITFIIIASLITTAITIGYTQDQVKLVNLDHENKVLEECQKLYKKGDFIKALDLLEPEFEKRKIKYNYFGGMGSTEEFMTKMYVRSNQIAQGVEFFYRLYSRDKNEIEGSNKISRLEEFLLNLAIKNGSFDIAMEVAITQKKRLGYPGPDINFARIYAARGDKGEALKKIRSYLNYEYADSRTQLIAIPELAPLHGDSIFQELMTETNKLVEARHTKPPKSAIMGENTEKLSLEEIVIQAEVYKKVTDIEKIKLFQKELQIADKIISPNIEKFKNELFELLQKEKKSVYYRLILAMLLTSLGEPDLTRSVVEELKDDNLLKFPQQLFRLSYQVARSKPREVKPLLFQMLGGEKGSIFLPQHFLMLNWDQLL